MNPAATAHELCQKREQIMSAWPPREGKDVVLAALNGLIAKYEAEAERTTNPPVSGDLALDA
jgi:hypothetical protein